MGKYCDSAQLEIIWSNWGFATSTPELEPLRKKKLLYKQHSGQCTQCVIAKSEPFFFGVLNKIENIDAILATTINSHHDDKIAEILTQNNFSLDVPAHISWNQLTITIYDICKGLALKFNPPSDEERYELANEAFKQTVEKIQRGKLKFTPGRAPVFNLLTTAIFRIMYSIKNKEKRYRINQAKLTADISNNISLPKFRSLKITNNTT